MISNTAVIYPPLQTQCRPVCGRVEGSQSQVTPDTPWPSGLAFPRPPVFEGHQILQSDAHWRRLKGDLSCLGCVCTGRWWNKSREGVDWYGLHWGCLTLRSDFCSNLAQVSDFVKTNFSWFLGDLCQFCDFSQGFSCVGTFIWETWGHVSQSSSMDISKWDFWLCQSMIFWVLLCDYLCDFYNFSRWHMRFLHIHHQWVWVQGVCLLAALKLQQIFLQFRQIGNLV